MESAALANQPEGSTPSPYQIDVDQTLRASQALLRHLQTEAKRLQDLSSKKSLLETAPSDSDDENGPSDHETVWLTLTTKQHIVDKNRLRPGKIAVPHSLNKSDDLSICLIVADPQRDVKNIVADPSFPHSLSKRINRIIGYSKLKARYKTFESRRQLIGEHDIFLADDRIINRLPETLGKVFYKGTAKRPIPIIIAHQNRQNGRVVKDPTRKQNKDKTAAFASGDVVAKEIEKALSSVPVSLKPGTNVAVRVGNTGFSGGELADNVVTVTHAIIEKHVVKGWRNVKSIHIKAPNSAAMPIWLADDMWAEDESVIPSQLAESEQATIEGKTGSGKRKRENKTGKGPQVGMRKRAKVPGVEVDQSVRDAQIRRDRLTEEKSKAYNI